VRIKTGVERDAILAPAAKPAEEVVKLRVDEKSNAEEYQVSAQDLEKSPVLSSWVCKQGTGGPFIMHPELLSMSPKHFQSVAQVLMLDLYMPLLEDNPKEADLLPKRLEGRTTDQEYRD
jgi:hypothetical protein